MVCWDGLWSSLACSLPCLPAERCQRLRLLRLNPGLDFCQLSEAGCCFVEPGIGTGEEQQLFDLLEAHVLFQRHSHVGFKGRAWSIQALVHHINGDRDQCFGGLVDQGLPPDLTSDPGAEVAEGRVNSPESLLQGVVIEHRIGQPARTCMAWA